MARTDHAPCPASPYKLNLGSGHMGTQEGWQNCDLYPGPQVDHVFDLQGAWPFPDHSASELYSSHVVEHLTDPKAFFKEAWRVLLPNGTLLVRVPFGGHRAAWWDLSHVRPWYPEAFAFVRPGYAKACGNPQHDDWQYPFGVQIVKMRVSYKLARWLRHWWVRWLFQRYSGFFEHEIEEIWAYLFALKTPEAVEQYRATHEPHIVGATFSAWRHHLKGCAPPTDGSCVMVDLCGGVTINGFIGRVMGEERG